MANQCWQNSWWEPSPNSWDLTDCHDSGWKRDAQWASLSKVKTTPMDFVFFYGWDGSEGDERSRSWRRELWVTQSGETRCDHISSPNTVWKERLRHKIPHVTQLAETQCSVPHHNNGNTGQSSSNSSWKPRVREDAVTQRPQHTGDPGYLTLAPKFRGDPWIEFSNTQ